MKSNKTTKLKITDHSKPFSTNLTECVNTLGSLLGYDFMNTKNEDYKYSGKHKNNISTQEEFLAADEHLTVAYDLNTESTDASNAVYMVVSLKTYNRAEISQPDEEALKLLPEEFRQHAAYGFKGNWKRAAALTKELIDSIYKKYL